MNDEIQLTFNNESLSKALECLLFVASEPLTEKQMAEICGVSRDEVKTALLSLEEAYIEHGFSLKQIAGGWQFMTAQEYAKIIEKLYRPKFHQLSNAAMETLAIIAYKQPITRAQISEIRQVDADSVVANLLDKRLIKEVGRMDIPGHPILYGTSNDFLSFFGINSIHDLPQLPENENEQITDSQQ